MPLEKLDQQLFAQLRECREQPPMLHASRHSNGNHSSDRHSRERLAGQQQEPQVGQASSVGWYHDT
jgi:hypothetical protein